MTRSGAAVALIVSACLLAAGAALGFWGSVVEGPCMKPYAECAGSGHLGELWGGLVLIILAAVAGLAGLVILAASLRVLWRPARRSAGTTRSGDSA